MMLLNFSYPLTPSQLSEVEQLTKQKIEHVLDVRTQFDNELSFQDQARALVESVRLAPVEWQTTPLITNLPSFAPIAALVLAELHGRIGHFPTVLRLRPVPESTPQQFEVAEILNLQAVREAAREKR